MTETPLELKDWRFTIDTEGIAWAIFDREGESANALGRGPLEELGKIVEWINEISTTQQVLGLGILSAKKSFIVGADIREFDQLDTEDKVVEGIGSVINIFDQIESMKIPVVCGIHGPCLGGGLELALACHYRIATRDDSTKIGFPEVKLGLFPGFNGTARSIRQVGPIAAMQNMLTGKMLRASVGRSLGYLDRLVESPQELRWAVRRAILRKSRSYRAAGASRVLALGPLRNILANRILKETRKTAREQHYPAPYRLIDLFQKHGGNFDEMKREETRAFAPLMVSETSRNLRRVFRLSELLKSQAPKDTSYKPLRAHVIGAGTMGADIAGWCVAAGMQVSLQDISEEQIEKGIAAQESLFERRFRTASLQSAAKARLIADPNGSHVRRADIVIEAIVENLAVKQRMFAEVETQLKPGAIMATNTSSIMIEDIAGALKDPGRLIGIHFFNPVAKMPLVEVIRGEASRDEEVQRGCAFVVAIAKFPLIVKSAPGFLVNRVLAPYLFEAFRRLEEGANIAVLDEAARVFGMPMGPIELADTVGLDVCAHVGEVLKGGLEGSKLEKLVSAGKLGKKTGEGFYLWKDGKPQGPEPEASNSELERLGLQLVDPLLGECKKCLDDGIVASSDLVDAGVVFGTGFAPFRGGPLHYVETLGSQAHTPGHIGPK
ncbi:MAG: 3-hydroxyacyl-CoA dehydrogenase NAD-binding domain-containing protein [Hyphomicrobiaceae bacterium]